MSRCRHLAFVLITYAICGLLKYVICEEEDKFIEHPTVDRSHNEIPADLTFPSDNAIPETLDKTSNHTTEEKQPSTARPTAAQTSAGSTTNGGDRGTPIDPADQYLLHGILDIVDEKFSTLNKRIMNLERGINNLQYYNVRSFRVVNTHLHAVDTILHTMHTQMTQSEQQNKQIEHVLRAIKDEIVDLQSTHTGVFQTIEQNLVHSFQDIQSQVQEIKDGIEQANVNIDRVRNDSSDIIEQIEAVKTTQNDMKQDIETTVMLVSEGLQNTISNANITRDLYSLSLTTLSISESVQSSILDVIGNVSMLSIETEKIRNDLSTLVSNISTTRYKKKDSFSADEEEATEKSNFHEFRTSSSHLHMTCEKMMEWLDEKLKLLNVTFADSTSRKTKTDFNSADQEEFKNHSKKLLRALATVNDNIFQSVTLYKHTGSLIERVIADTEFIASEQIRLREDLLAYLVNGTFGLFNQSGVDMSDFVFSQTTKSSQSDNSDGCSDIKNLTNEVLKLSRNGTQLVDLLTDLASTSSTAMKQSLDKLNNEVSRLNRIQDDVTINKSDVFARDDSRLIGNTQLREIQNKTEWIYQLVEAIASNTGWIPYVFHHLRFVENQVNKTLKYVADADVRMEEIHKSNIACLFKPTSSAPPKINTTPPIKTSPKDHTGGVPACDIHSAFANSSSVLGQMIEFVFNTNFKISRLLPALTNLLGEPEPYITLVNGSSDREGRIEIYHKGQWGNVADSLNHVEASYVCRKLGYLGGVSAGNGHFGAGRGALWNLNVTCLKTRWCNAISHMVEPQMHSHHNAAGVICDHMLRLVPSTETEDPEILRHTGKLEIYHHNSWVPVCFKGWGRQESNVVCNQLGYREGSASGARDETIADTTWMMNVTCKGNENRLDTCIFNGFRFNGCSDYTYVFMICS